MSRQTKWCACPCAICKTGRCCMDEKPRPYRPTDEQIQAALDAWFMFRKDESHAVSVSVWNKMRRVLIAADKVRRKP